MGGEMRLPTGAELRNDGGMAKQKNAAAGAVRKGWRLEGAQWGKLKAEIGVAAKRRRTDDGRQKGPFPPGVRPNMSQC